MGKDTAKRNDSSRLGGGVWKVSKETNKEEGAVKEKSVVYSNLPLPPPSVILDYSFFFFFFFDSQTYLPPYLEFSVILAIFGFDFLFPFTLF